ncbi:MAG: riboflavin synthase subunit alpha [Pseudomonadota bacterium]|nr:riboflavin synthase subunit alpha [Pseudomonadota bacterium]
MFTGIVQGLGEVTQNQDHGGIRRLQVRLPTGRDQGLETGASVAINGVCLTVVGWDQHGVEFDVIDETLRLTNLGDLKVGHVVNVERAARFGDEIGGHVLSGHIHGRAQVTEVVETDANLAVWWAVPEALKKYVLPKGYVSLNGCSLTVGDTERDGQLSIHLIPETRELTTFGRVTVGDSLNLEIDSQTQAIVDTVERVVEQRL